MTTKKVRYPQEEVEVVKRYGFRYTFHDLVVRPLLSSSSRKLRQGVFDLLKRLNFPIRFIVDIAAGDDTLIAELGEAFQAEVCLANDVSLESLLRLRGRASSTRQFVGVTYNALEMPEDLPYFDLGIAKNVLHHMVSFKEVEVLLTNLDHIARNILIIDLEDPALGTWQCRSWHTYYTYWLHDQGNRFLCRQAFHDVLCDFFKNNAIHFQHVVTPKGTYMIALVTKSEEPL